MTGHTLGPRQRAGLRRGRDMNRDELIRAGGDALIANPTHYNSRLHQFVIARMVVDAVLPLIEADLRERLAEELEERRSALPINRDNAPLNIALGIVRDLVRGATTDTDPAQDGEPRP